MLSASPLAHKALTQRIVKVCRCQPDVCIGFTSHRSQSRLCSGPSSTRGSRAVTTQASFKLFGLGKEPAEPQALTPEEEADQLALQQAAPSQRNLSFVSFWVQLALSVVSSGVLVFSVAFTPRTPGPAEFSKYLTMAGVVCLWLSTFFAHGFLTLSRKLVAGGTVARGWLQSSLLRNSMLNLVGVAATVVGLQASVGTLVAKTLVTAVQAPYSVGNNANTLVSLDVFSLQAATNCLLGHVVSLLFVNAMLGVMQRAPPRPPVVIAEGVPKV